MKLYYPAEWEPQKTIWLAFPHNQKNWRGAYFDKVQNFYFRLIEIISRFQKADVIIPNEFQLPRDLAKRLVKAKFNSKFIQFPTNDIWIRDYGPIFVYNEKGVEKIVKFQFNAWGAKFPPWRTDAEIPRKISERKRIAIKEYPYIFEGGAIEINGKGLGITTRSCLVGTKRNDPAEIKHVEKAICEAFGLDDLLVLPEGLYGDHTDGHIDNVVRFVSPTRAVMAWETDQDKPNFPRLLRIRAILETWLKRHYGEKAKVDTLQLPPQKHLGGGVLPASYMNFIFLNGALVYPQYDAELDKIAEKYFKKVFPRREIVGIDCTTVIRQGGSLHCLSKQECENPVTAKPIRARQKRQKD